MSEFNIRKVLFFLYLAFLEMPSTAQNWFPILINDKMNFGSTPEGFIETVIFVKDLKESTDSMNYKLNTIVAARDTCRELSKYFDSWPCDLEQDINYGLYLIDHPHFLGKNVVSQSDSIWRFYDGSLLNYFDIYPGMFSSSPAEFHEL